MKSVGGLCLWITYNYKNVDIMAIIIYFELRSCKIDVLMLFICVCLCLPENGDLLLENVGWFMFMDNL